MSPFLPASDSRVLLDVRRLKALRLRRGVPGTLSARFQARRHWLTRAALQRAVEGRPVAYRTARRLAAFHGIEVETLVDPRPWYGPLPADVDAHVPAVERLQCRAVIEAVRLAGCGRLVDVRGPAGAGKSRLLEACAADARPHGYAIAALGAAGPGSARHTAADLMLALLGLDAVPRAWQTSLAARVRERCWTLGLPAVHVDACLSLLDGQRRWPLPAVHLLQTAALCALVQHCAGTRPLLVSIDDIQRADWQLAMMLGVLVPATLDFPVLWLCAGDGVKGARLERMARTILLLAPQPQPQRTDRADAASVHRIERLPAAG